MAESIIPSTFGFAALSSGEVGLASRRSLFLPARATSLCTLSRAGVYSRTPPADSNSLRRGTHTSRVRGTATAPRTPTRRRALRKGGAVPAERAERRVARHDREVLQRARSAAAGGGARATGMTWAAATPRAGTEGVGVTGEGGLCGHGARRGALPLSGRRPKAVSPEISPRDSLLGCRLLQSAPPPRRRRRRRRPGVPACPPPHAPPPPPPPPLPGGRLAAARPPPPPRCRSASPLFSRCLPPPPPRRLGRRAPRALRRRRRRLLVGWRARGVLPDAVSVLVVRARPQPGAAAAGLVICADAGGRRWLPAARWRRAPARLTGGAGAAGIATWIVGADAGRDLDLHPPPAGAPGP